ncbi:MAG: alpha/beta hydrolase [Planctomycetaceae bacterium]|nr:alpha/beta hydrolase [Planctomycetaceae bacterium]
MMMKRITGISLCAAAMAWAAGVGAGADRPRPATASAPASAPARGGVRRDVEYARVGNKRLLLDLYLPARTDKPVPVIVWIHGGGWQQGSKTRTPAAAVPAMGYAGVSINYRLSQEAVFPAQIHDCKAAIRWVRAHAKEYNFDADRIGVWGASAGGHLVALLGTGGGVKELEGDVGGNKEYSSRVQAVCDWFGPTDFVPMALLPGRVVTPVTALLGGPVKDNLDKARLASPVTHATKDDPPFLIMHGDKDTMVHASQSRRLHDVLQKAGVDSTLKILEGAGHGGPAFTSPETNKLIREFFDKHLKKR